MIDGMSSGKLNVFHWHIIDSPSFPFESKLYPELSKEGSWGPGLKQAIYSQEDIKTVVAHAENRFIDVVLELDTPAHTMSIARAHPEVMTDCWEWMANSGYKLDVDSDDCMAMDPTSEVGRKMTTDLILEASELSANSKYFHVGGDEVKYPCWNQSSSIRETVQNRYGDLTDQSFAKLQAEWTANVSTAAVLKAGKIPVLWQPTVQGPGDPAWDNVLPKNSIYMIWLNQESEVAYAEAGMDVVYTTPFYVAGMGSDGWNEVHNAQIIPDGLSDEGAKHVLGAEICMW